MNFKPTLLKTIISIISGIAVNYHLANPGIQYGQIMNMQEPFPPPTLWIENAFDPLIILLTLITMCLVYVIWSLFQKKLKN
jgi:hypothetical protein